MYLQFDMYNFVQTGEFFGIYTRPKKKENKSTLPNVHLKCTEKKKEDKALKEKRKAKKGTALITKY